MNELDIERHERESAINYLAIESRRHSDEAIRHAEEAVKWAKRSRWMAGIAVGCAVVNLGLLGYSWWL